MPAGKHNTTIEQGTTYYLRLQWLIDDVPVPAFTQGWSARMQVRETIESTTPLVSVTSDGGDIIINDLGLIDITIPATTTETLPPFVYPDHAFWDLELYRNTEVMRLLEGWAYVTPEVTR
jgi:hypothetical protein